MENQKKITVLKLDGSHEEFQPEKIARVVKAAGLSDEQAKQLSLDVTNWVNTQANGEITTLQIRDKVLEELRKVNSYAANLYEWYEKTKKET